VPVRHAILGLLHQRPRHGYDLREAYVALVGGPLVWDLKPAQVYTTLQRLERDGLIVPGATGRFGGPDRTVYELTDAGLRELAAWFSAGVHGEHVRDTFFVKLMVAVSTPEADSREVIHIQRATLYRDLHALTSRRAALDRGTDLARVMLLDKAVMHLEADLRWLEMVEGRLGEIERQPIPLPEVRRRGRPPKAEGLDSGPPGEGTIAGAG
jgi:DNA-binding PadR family transcriptional regulator